jgi:hypothetical protein
MDRISSFQDQNAELRRAAAEAIEAITQSKRKK